MLPRKPKLPFGFLVSSIKEFENRLERKLKDKFTNKKQNKTKQNKTKTNRLGKLETLQLPGEGKTEKKSGMEVRKTAGACSVRSLLT